MTKLARGLAFPPGLETPQPPPGLEHGRALNCVGNSKAVNTQDSARVAGPVYNVVICGLPKGVLSEPMMEAVLEQAGLAKAVLGFHAIHGKRCGEVSVQLTGFAAVERCVLHFHGRQWGESAALVTVCVPLPVHNRGREEPGGGAAAGSGTSSLPMPKAQRRRRSATKPCPQSPSPDVVPATSLTVKAMGAAVDIGQLASEPDASTDAGESCVEEEGPQGQAPPEWWPGRRRTLQEDLEQDDE